MVSEIRYSDDELLISRFEDFLEEFGYAQLIPTLSDFYPDERSLVIEYNDLNKYSDEIMGLLQFHPNNFFHCIEEAVKRLMPVKNLERGALLHVRINDAPKRNSIIVRELRAKHLGNFIAVEGRASRVTEVKPRLVDAKFKCLRCGAILKEHQEDLFFKEPLECYEEQNGCKRTAASTKFKLLSEESTFVDTQKLEIEENPEGKRGGAQPQRLVAYVEDDIVGDINPGDRISLVGTLRTTQKAWPTKSNMFETFLEVNNISHEQHDFEEFEPTEDEKKEFLKVSEDPRLYDKIKGSIAPAIYGYPIEKEALALQLFGGVAKTLSDGTKVRGDIHILLVGDPGTAKSQLIRYISKMAPRGSFTSGKSASAAGLTAAVVKDDFGEGRWTLEAGALVLADKGHACIDELDKMSKNDTSALHEAMEQQTISIAKAGVNAKLLCRCALLAAANPKLGRFSATESKGEQIDLPPALLSRFDVILPFTDKPNKDLDGRIAQHILNNHYVGEILRHGGEGISQAQIEKRNELAEQSVPYLDRDFLKRYIAYAKRNVFPVLSQEAIDLIKDYYVNIRNKSEQKAKDDGGSTTIPITARQLEAFIRLAEASARTRLSHEVRKQDASRAINIVEHYLHQVAGEDGSFDIDIIATGMSKPQADRKRVIRAIVKSLGDNGRMFHIDKVIAMARDEGIDKGQTETLMKRMHQRDGIIYEVRTGSGEFRYAGN